MLELQRKNRKPFYILFIYANIYINKKVKKMKVVQRKTTKERHPQIHIWVPAWVIKELGIQPGDKKEEWIPLEDDNGERLVALRRAPRERDGEKEKQKEKGEDGGDKTD